MSIRAYTRTHGRRGVPLPAPACDPPPGWVRDQRRGGYVRQLHRHTLSLHPACGSWFWVLVAADGREARYSRRFRRLSDCLAAAEQVARAEAVAVISDVQPQVADLV
jgi:hypothetical protein